MQSKLLSIQKFLVAYKQQLLTLFRIGELGLVLLLIVGSYSIFTNPMASFTWFEIGRHFGYIGLCFYVTTLIPGILTRLRWQPLIGAMITPFRRHLGIIMFLCAFIHQSFVVTLPSIALGVPINLALSTDNPKIFGIAALTALFPLWLTSNDSSQKYLGKRWKILHRLTYVALLLIFLHVAFLRKNWAILAGIVLGLEALSWLVFWWRTKRSSKMPAVVPVSPPTTK